MRIVHLENLSVAITDEHPTFWDAVERGAWEPLTLSTIRAYCRHGVVFIDCGAWVGPTTLVAAGTGARVIAVEADPVALRQLAANLDANPALARRVTVVPRALSAKSGWVAMGSRRKAGSSFSSTLHADAPAHWIVEAVTPAELIRIAGSACPLLTKVDIEGGEYAVVPVMVPFINRPRSAVQLSLHPTILAEVSGADEVSQATRQILLAFEGWAAFRAEGCEWSAVREPLSSGVLARATHHATDWLFVRN